jgi:hypothetical protein
MFFVVEIVGIREYDIICSNVLICCIRIARVGDVT